MRSFRRIASKSWNRKVSTCKDELLRRAARSFSSAQTKMATLDFLNRERSLDVPLKTPKIVWHWTFVV
jgi:hypothetical protein